ncbi:hypothetical protein RCL1_004804 [Eukaryota sp. TZLM3-RCL]
MQTLAIDLGSSRLRLGYCGDAFPSIDCATYISKVRGKGVLCGDIALEQHTARSPFDGLYCTSFEILETLLDNTISTILPQSPPRFCITEPLANPWVLRQPLAELLFEAYQSPAVSLSVDSLCAHGYLSLLPNSPLPSFSSCLLVHVGHRATYTIPITPNGPDMSSVKRIPIGGEQLTSFMSQLLYTRHSLHTPVFTPFLFENLKRNFCYFASNYHQELNIYSSINPRLKELAVHHYLNYSTQILDEEAVKKAEIRRQKASDRLRGIQAQRKKLKEEAKAEEIFDSKFEESKETRLLDPQLAAMQAGRQRMVERKQKEQAQEEETQRLQQEFKQNFPEKWLELKVSEYNELCERIFERKKMEKSSKRKAAGADRLRLVSRDLLAENDTSFGVNDEDWQVYRSADRETQLEILNSEISSAIALEEEIRAVQIDFPSHPALTISHLKGAFALQPAADVASLATSSSVVESWDSHLHLGTERIMVPELLFKPYLNRVDVMGLSEIFELYSKSQHANLLSNILVTGAGANIPGIKDRILNEVTCLLPLNTEIQVATDTSALNSWLGLSNLIDNGLEFMSIQEYYEYGVYGWLRHQSRFSNYYYRQV